MDTPQTILAIFTLRASARRLAKAGWTREDLLDNAAIFVTDPGSYVQRDDQGEDVMQLADGPMSSYWRGPALRNATSFLEEDWPQHPFSGRLVVAYDVDGSVHEQLLEKARQILEDAIVGYEASGDEAPYDLTSVRVIDGSAYPDVVAEHRKRTIEFDTSLSA
jgi:hypothetical protein